MQSASPRDPTQTPDEPVSHPMADGPQTHHPMAGTVLSSEIALDRRLVSKGQPPEVVLSWGPETPHEQLVRSREGGFVGRAFGGKRAAFEPRFVPEPVVRSPAPARRQAPSVATG